MQLTVVNEDGFRVGVVEVLVSSETESEALVSGESGVKLGCLVSLLRKPLQSEVHRRLPVLQNAVNVFDSRRRLLPFTFWQRAGPGAGRIEAVIPLQEALGELADVRFGVHHHVHLPRIDQKPA